VLSVTCGGRISSLVSWRFTGAAGAVVAGAAGLSIAEILGDTSAIAPATARATARRIITWFMSASPI